MKKLVLWLLTLALLLTACGEAAGSAVTAAQSAAAETAGTDVETPQAWTETEADVSGLSPVTTLCDTIDPGEGVVTMQNGQVYVQADTGETTTVTAYSYDGTTRGQVTLLPPEAGAALYRAECYDGGAYALYCVTREDENAEEATLSYYVQGYDRDGTLKWQYTLDEILAEAQAEDTQFYSDSILAGEDFLIATGEHFLLLGPDGELKAAAESSMEQASLCLGGDGTVYVKSGYTVCPLDLETLTPGAELLSLDNGEQLFTGSGEYDLLLLSFSRVRGVSVETHTITTLLELADCDLTSSVNGILYLGENTYGVGAVENLAGDSQLLTLSFVPADQVPEKTVVRMAVAAPDGDWTGNLDSDTVYAINAFNRASDTWRVEVEPYDSGQALQLMLVSETPPDIIVFSSSMEESANWTLYARKGYLADLAGLFEKDTALSADMLMPNVVSAFTWADGGLYALPTEFYAVAQYASRQYVGDASSLSFSELYQLLQALPEEVSAPGEGRPSLMLQGFLDESLGLYVDMAAGTCDFQQDSFYDLLALCRDYSGNTLLGGAIVTEFASSSINGASEGAALLNDAENAILAYPGTAGSGAMLKAPWQYAITAAAAQPEGAWAFLRTLFTEKFQNQALPFLSVRADFYEKQLDAARENYGEQVSAEEIELADQLTRGAETRSSIGSPVIPIVLEEAEAYFSGDKTAQQTAELIESRVKIYLSEQS